jgi:hypothetical protein
MFWMTVAFCTLGLWGMLTAIGGERRRQLNELESRRTAESESKHE